MNRRDVLKRFGFYGLMFGAGMTVSPASAQAPTLNTAQAQILAQARTQAGKVWGQLGLAAGFTFDAGSVDIAYFKLTQRRSVSETVELLTRTGPFLHLVKQGVMLNAARFSLTLPRNLLVKAFYSAFDAQGTSARLAAVREQYGKYILPPFDPNGMSGPVSRSLQPVDKGSGPHAAAVGADVVGPYFYSIYFENLNGPGVGDATDITIEMYVNPLLQQVTTFTPTELTWNSSVTAPTQVALFPGGPRSSIAPGTAVVPALGQTFYLFYANGMQATLRRDLSGGFHKFTLRLQPCLLRAGENGSISFVMDPVGVASATNAAMPSATITFRNSALPPTVVSVPTNTWLRPFTVF